MKLWREQYPLNSRSQLSIRRDLNLVVRFYLRVLKQSKNVLFPITTTNAMTQTNKRNIRLIKLVLSLASKTLKIGPSPQPNLCLKNKENS